MISSLKKIYLREQFQPKIFGMLLNPFYFSRRGLFIAIRAIAPRLKGKTLDIGCGSKPYSSLCASNEYIGLEIDNPENRNNSQANYFYDGKKMPFRDAEFDSIICNQVLEHVFTPDEFIREIYRVMKPGAQLLLSVPFVWDEHEQPYDYARYSSFGLRALLEKQGFEIIEQYKTMADFRAIAQLLTAALYKKIMTKNLYGNALLTIIFIAPITILSTVIALVLPGNTDFYLDNIVLARRKE